jgi:hypothetical protein
MPVWLVAMRLALNEAPGSGTVLRETASVELGSANTGAGTSGMTIRRVLRSIAIFGIFAIFTLFYFR